MREAKDVDAACFWFILLTLETYRDVVFAFMCLPLTRFSFSQAKFDDNDFDVSTCVSHLCQKCQHGVESFLHERPKVVPIAAARRRPGPQSLRSTHLMHDHRFIQCDCVHRKLRAALHTLSGLFLQTLAPKGESIQLTQKLPTSAKLCADKNIALVHQNLKYTTLTNRYVTVFVNPKNAVTPTTPGGID